MNELLLDTHTLIWFMNGDSKLLRSAQKTINAAIQQNKVSIAAISLWEIAMLEARNKITFDISCSEWINTSLRKTKIAIKPITPEIAIDSCSLPFNFHGDPADRLIIATARIERLTLVTADTKILSYSKHKYLSTLKAI